MIADEPIYSITSKITTTDLGTTKKRNNPRNPRIKRILAPSAPPRFQPFRFRPFRSLLGSLSPPLEITDAAPYSGLRPPAARPLPRRAGTRARPGRHRRPRDPRGRADGARGPRRLSATAATLAGRPGPLHPLRHRQQRRRWLCGRPSRP